MSKNVKISNPMKVITGVDTRWSYANVWEPKSINGGTPKYSVSLIIPKSDTKTIAKIEAAIEAAYKEGEAKLKGNGKSVPVLSVLKTPLRDGDAERPDDEAYKNAYFVNANGRLRGNVYRAALPYQRNMGRKALRTHRLAGTDHPRPIRRPKAKWLPAI